VSAARRAVTHLAKPDAERSACTAWLGTKAKRTTEKRDVTCVGCSRAIKECEDRAWSTADECGEAGCAACGT
jgi:hypothetical protein